MIGSFITSWQIAQISAVGGGTTNSTSGRSELIAWSFNTTHETKSDLAGFSGLPVLKAKAKERIPSDFHSAVQKFREIQTLHFSGVTFQSAKTPLFTDKVSEGVVRYVSPEGSRSPPVQ